LQTQSRDVVLDPGHGGETAVGKSTPVGARGARGTLEKTVTLALARRVADRVGARAILTRTEDVNLSLAERSATARRNGAAVFVSLHANSGQPGARGPEIYVHPQAGASSRTLAEALARALSAGGPPARTQAGELAVLTPDRHAAATAACLVEVDYLSDPEAEARLRDPQALDEVAAALAAGVHEYLRVVTNGSAPLAQGQLAPAAMVPIAGLAVATFMLVNTLARQAAGGLTWSRNITAAIHSYPDGVTANDWQDQNIQVLGVDAAHNSLLSSAWAKFNVAWRYNGNDIDQCRVESDSSSDWTTSALTVSFEGNDAASYEQNSVGCVVMYLRGTFDPSGEGDVDFEGRLLIKADGTMERLGMRITRGTGVTVWEGSMVWSERDIPFTGGTQGEWGNQVGWGGYFLQKA
jgi:N-acetylmuramoyl-L-alanine amidase